MQEENRLTVASRLATGIGIYILHAPKERRTKLVQIVWVSLYCLNSSKLDTPCKGHIRSAYDLCSASKRSLSNHRIHRRYFSFYLCVNVIRPTLFRHRHHRKFRHQSSVCCC